MDPVTPTKPLAEFPRVAEQVETLVTMRPEELMRLPIFVHGNGFIQVDLNPITQLQVWDHELKLGQMVPTPIHDHRFDFEAVTLVSALFNCEYAFEEDPEGDLQVFVAVPHDRQDTRLEPLIPPGRFRGIRFHQVNCGSQMVFAGQGYSMAHGKFHEDHGEALTAVLQVKTYVNQDHKPRVLVPIGRQPDNEFNRYQYNPGDLWGSVLRAVQGVAL